MTLKRKGLIHWYVYAFWYSSALFISMYYMFLAKSYMFFVYVAFCFYLRFKFNINKYVIWVGYLLVYYNSEQLKQLLLY